MDSSESVVRPLGDLASRLKSNALRHIQDITALKASYVWLERRTHGLALCRQGLMAATSDQDWGDNWQQQVEEAVALHSILGTDFQIYPVNGLPESLEALYQGADEIQLQGLPADCLQFQAIVHLELPSGSLRLQVIYQAFALLQTPCRLSCYAVCR